MKPEDSVRPSARPATWDRRIARIGSRGSPLVLAGKIAFDVATAAKLSIDQWTKHKAFCFWCLVAATATFATAPLAIPEARTALARLSERVNVPD